MLFVTLLKHKILTENKFLYIKLHEELEDLFSCSAKWSIYSDDGLCNESETAAQNK